MRDRETAIAIVLVSVIFATTMSLEAAFAQEGHSMDAITDESAEESPAVYDIPESNIQVKVSWQPEIINTDEPTRFTFEFLNSTTGEHLQDVSYAVHMALDGKSMGHGHESKAPDGIGTIEQQFDSKGSLSIIIDSIAAGDAPAIDGYAQFNLVVTPEFPIMLVGVLTSVAVMGSAIASRLYFSKI